MLEREWKHRWVGGMGRGYKGWQTPVQTTAQVPVGQLPSQAAYPVSIDKELRVSECPWNRWRSSLCRKVRQIRASSLRSWPFSSWDKHLSLPKGHEVTTLIPFERWNADLFFSWSVCTSKICRYPKQDALDWFKNQDELKLEVVLYLNVLTRLSSDFNIHELLDWNKFNK